MASNDEFACEKMTAVFRAPAGKEVNRRIGPTIDSAAMVIAPTVRPLDCKYKAEL